LMLDFRVIQSMIRWPTLPKNPAVASEEK
jgi:hypothetical protein